MATYLSDVLARNRNNFNLLRLVAAIAVVWGHKNVHFSKNPSPEFVSAFVRGYEFSGSIAVYVFFLVSGILVSASYDRQNSTSRFLALRFARIWPAAIACSVFALTLLGPSMAGDEALDFVSKAETWSCLKLDLTILAGTCWDHSMMFVQANLPSKWNSPLWTLPLEVHCYWLVAVIGLTPLWRSRTALVCTSAAIAATFLTIAKVYPRAIGYDFFMADGYSFYPIPFFLVGIALYALRDHVPIHWSVAASLTVGYLALRQTSIGLVFLYPCLIYGSLFIAASPTIRRVAKIENDYSYGVYIYGFIVGQIISNYWPETDGLTGFAITLAITFMLAAMSWHMIERPAMELCRSMLGQPSPGASLKPA